MPENENGRPGRGGRKISKAAAISISSSVPRGADDQSEHGHHGDVVRCSRCRCVLTAERSVALELGPVCRKAVAA